MEEYYMDGTIFQLKKPGDTEDNRTGPWVAEISIDGVKRRFYGNKESEAKKKLREYIKEVAKGDYIKRNNIKVKEWATTWLEKYKAASLSDVTYENYTYQTAHIIEHFGNHNIQKLTTDNMQTFVNILIGENLSSRSIHDIVATTKQCFGKAKSLGYIKKNPMIGVELPRVLKKAKTVLSSDDIEGFKDIQTDHRMYPAILMQIMMGLRKGEVLGLAKADIDLDNGFLSIHQTQAHTKTLGIYIKPYPKNDSSIRTIPMHTEVIEALRGYQWIDNKAGINGEQIAFVTSKGTLISPRNFLRDVYAIFGRKVNDHELRHTFITNMCNKGVNPTITAQIAGHVDTRMVNNVYNHPNMDNLRDAMNS
jgi:integrase